MDGALNYNFECDRFVELSDNNLTSELVGNRSFLNLKPITIKGIVIWLMISIGNSMICSDIWHKYHEWYFKIVLHNFTSRPIAITTFLHKLLS